MKTKKKNKKKGQVVKNKKRIKAIKWIILVILILGALSLVLLSDLFNIKEIVVLNNNKITKDEIIYLSGLKINENMFKFLKLQAEEQIKQNPYIASATIHRKINGKIEIEVKERVATYLLQMEEEYAYINNQGYILEKNTEKLELPTVTGYITENIEPGNRLEVEDLKKLNTVIQIVKSAGEKNLASKISNIDITSDTDFIVSMNSENKKIHFGDASNINDKILRLESVLADTVEQKGEIFVKDINKVYFRSEV